MTNALNLIKPEVRNLAPYTLRHHEHRVKLNQNENPFGFPEALKEEVWRRARGRDWARYPDFFLREITERLAQHADVPPDWVLVGNGSNELIQVTLMATLARGDTVIIPVPTFTLYRLMSTVMGAQVVEVPLSQGDFALPTEAIVAAAREHRARVVILCSPNNPTGVAYPEGQVRRIVEETEALVVLDEAYREFSDQDFRPLLDGYDNLILLRTFSKAMAMAGLRVGYLLARPELVRELAKARLPYGLNLLSETAALVALDHRDLLEAQVRRIRALRNVLHAELRALPGVHPYPSQANFLLCRFDRPTEEVFAALLANGILVRDVSGYPLLAGHLRISVGRERENEALVRTLKELS
ncbi:MAG: histidinol-phosphate transaminase [Anaerolineae bacterium]